MVFTVRGRARAGGVVASGLASSFPAFLRTLYLLTLPGAMIAFVHKLLDMNAHGSGNISLHPFRIVSVKFRGGR